MPQSESLLSRKALLWYPAVHDLPQEGMFLMQEISVAKVIANLEARLAFHREQEALHARQEEHHRDQRTVHASEIDKITRSLEAFRETAATAVELARPVPPPPPPDDMETGDRTMVSRLIARVVESRANDESFGASSVAAEVNQRYGKKLERPVDTRAASVVLRRLRARRQIHLVRKGKPAHEALYRRGPKP